MVNYAIHASAALSCIFSNEITASCQLKMSRAVVNEWTKIYYLEKNIKMRRKKTPTQRSVWLWFLVFSESWFPHQNAPSFSVLIFKGAIIVCIISIWHMLYKCLANFIILQNMQAQKREQCSIQFQIPTYIHKVSNIASTFINCCYYITLRTFQTINFRL